jgi:hypothetical protein
MLQCFKFISDVRVSAVPTIEIKKADEVPSASLGNSTLARQQLRDQLTACMFISMEKKKEGMSQ